MNLYKLICTEDILDSWSILLGVEGTYKLINLNTEIWVYHDTEEEKIGVTFFKEKEVIDTIYFYDKGTAIKDFFDRTIPAIGKKLRKEDVLVPLFNKRILDSLF